MSLKFRSFFAVILAVVLALSFVSCSSEDKTVTDNVNPTEVSGELLTDAVTLPENEVLSSLKEEKETTEKITEKEKTTKKEFGQTAAKKNKTYLKEAIGAILAFEYKGYREDFIKFDIYNQPERELELIYNTDYYDLCDPSLYPIDYNWYKDGVVNEDLLYERIVKNNSKAGILMTPDCKRIAKMVAYVAQYNIDYLKETLPSFNFNIPLYHLNTVTVDTSNEEWYYGLYVYDTNRILVNFTDIDTEKFFRSNVSHELFHLFARGQVGLDKFYLAGSSVDTLETSERPLEQNFLNEWFVNRASYVAFGEEPNKYFYDIEQQKIELICLSTDRDIYDFEALAFGVDKSLMYYAFEEELRNPNFVYSTLCGYDVACYYGFLPEDVDLYMLKCDCEIYATINVLKNAYIRLLKEISSDEITYQEACKEIDAMKTLLQNFDYDISTGKATDELENIFHTYAVNL